MSEIHAFAYRDPRFALALRIEFDLNSRCITGRSQNISAQGLLVFLTEPVLPGTVGRLRLHIERCTVEIEAEVTYAHLCEVGLHFRFASEEERRFVATLVKLVGKDTTRQQRERRAVLR